MNEPLESYVLEYTLYSGSEQWTSEGIELVGGEVINGVLGSWDLNVVSNNVYLLRLTVFYGGNQLTSEAVVAVDHLYKEGWPVSLLAERYPAAIKDLDTDGDKDVVVTTAFGASALNYDGSLLQEWGAYTGLTPG